jgi:hypothetical protein
MIYVNSNSGTRMGGHDQRHNFSRAAGY